VRPVPDKRDALASASFLSAIDSQRVLIVGGTGLIGSTVAEVISRRRRLVGSGPRSLTVLSRSRPASIPEGVCHVAGSVLDLDLADRRLEADLCVYVAGTTSNYLADPSATFLTSTEGFRRLLNALPAIERTVLISSTRVYGARRDDTPLHEDAPCVLASPDLRNVYDAAKIIGEALALQATQAGRTICIARLTNVYGPIGPGAPPTVFTQMVGQAAATGRIQVTGAPTSVRNHIHVVDAAQGILRALVLGASGRAYNIGSADHVAAEPLARIIAEAAPRPVAIELLGGDRRPDHMWISTDRARTELGFDATIALRTVLPAIVTEEFARVSR
jgi:dihydroflavonol-4-reductase